jgi:hypothetical protein
VNPTVHVLSQFLWPDDAPTGIYGEQLADRLAAAGIVTRLVGGRGPYRRGERPPPRTPIERVSHHVSHRPSLASTAREYWSLARAFERYIGEQVRRRDLVVMTSAPPTTIRLHRLIHERGATAVYWLQDYYPELLRTICDGPRAVRRPFARYWDRHLERWDRVVKVATNLAYDGANALVIRNWPTLDPGPAQAAVPRTALYSGNLGFPHHLPSFLEGCATLAAEGYAVTVRGDGRGMRRLPPWVRARPPCTDPAELARSYWEAEVHLVAAHPKFPGAVFPSKYWNSRAVGRRIVLTGFAGPMLDEVQLADKADPAEHPGQWVDLVAHLLALPPRG